jgi:hypothetical protein
MLKIVIFLISTLSVAVDIVHLMPFCNILEGSASRCWCRVRARQEEEEVRSTRSLYRRLSYFIPLFCVLKFFTNSLFVTQYWTKEREHRKTERRILFYARNVERAKWRHASGESPQQVSESIGSNECALRKRIKVVKYLKTPV